MAEQSSVNKRRGERMYKPIRTLLESGRKRKAGHRMARAMEMAKEKNAR
jgi:hypothetical protein